MVVLRLFGIPEIVEAYRFVTFGMAEYAAAGMSSWAMILLREVKILTVFLCHRGDLWIYAG